MSDSSEFHVSAAATENVCLTNSVCVLAANSRKAAHGTAGWIRLIKYAGIDDDSILNVKVRSCR